MDGRTTHRQDPDEPYEQGRAYAQTTRMEFGRALGWKDHDPSVDISLGIEPGYIGNDEYYRHCAGEFDIPVHQSIENLCLAVLEKLAVERKVGS